MKYEKIDFLDKLICSSEPMQKILEEEYNLKFRGDENDKESYDFFWKINEDLESYSIQNFSSNKRDEYNTLIDVELIDIEKDKYQLTMNERYIPDRTKSQKEILIDYLKFRLVDNGDFKMWGPNSLIHFKTDDKILVYIRTDTIMIVHDGECVVDNFSINWFSFHPTNVDAEMLDYYYQEIVHHF